MESDARTSAPIRTFLRHAGRKAAFSEHPCPASQFFGRQLAVVAAGPAPGEEIDTDCSILPWGIGYCMIKHTSHPEIVKRLKRADGHLRVIIEMI